MTVPRLSRPWSAAILVAVVVYLCFFDQLGALGLVGPDEPRYAAVAREMAETGDWVTPRLYGQPWLEKPVLYYWSAAGAFRLLGVSEFAARLPAALAALLGTLALGWTAWRLYGAATAWLVMLLFPTTVGALGFARAASPDMLFSGLLLVALAAAVEVILLTPRGQAPNRVWQGVLGAALGGAVLAKGPAGIVLAGGGVLLWGIFSGRVREAFRPLHARVLLWFLLAALPWHVLVAQHNPDFVDQFILGHNVARYLTPVFQHQQPAWFFGPVLLLGLLPWTLLLAGPVREALRRGKALASGRGFFLACWALFPVAFFSFSQSKLPGYVLPAVGPLVLLAARSLARGLEAKERFSDWLLAGAGITVAALAAWSPQAIALLPEAARPAAAGLGPWVWMAIGAGAAAALLALARLPRASVVLLALLVAAVAAGGNRWAVPRLDPHLSPRMAARQLGDTPPAGEPVMVFRIHRAWHYGLNFYLRRPLPRWQPETPGAAWVYASEAGWKEMDRSGRAYFVLRYFSKDAVLLHVK